MHYTPWKRNLTLDFYGLGRIGVCLLGMFGGLVSFGGLESIGGYSYGGGVHVALPEGHVLCDKCKGQKKVECISCKGLMPGRRCIRCDGVGVVKCGKCNGTGAVKERRTTSARSQQGRLESPVKTGGDKNVLRQKLERQKDYLRAYVRDNDIVCTSRVQLAEMNLALIAKCRDEDLALKRLCKEAGVVLKFPDAQYQVLSGGQNLEDEGKAVSFISFSEGALEELLSEMKRKYVEMTGERSGGIVKPEYYKKFCDVHKWDDECCPRFGGDYFTEDMKLKYASNKMQAYELAKKGVITCVCSVHLLKYQRAQKEYEAAVLAQKRADSELAAKYQRLCNDIRVFRNGRIETERRLRAMERADEIFAVIADLVKSIKAAR